MGETVDTKLIFFVNGQKVEDAASDPRQTLASYLRQKLRLTGTKIGCNEGGCGACTVMLSEVDYTKDGEIRHYSVNACLTPIGRVHGRHVITVEGIGSVRRRLHPVQERLSKGHGSQCGFCTPGFIMAMYALLRQNATPSIEEIEESIQGNLCRCTGYRPILESFYTFANNSGCCQKSANGVCCKSADGDKLALTDFADCRPYDETQELIFPSELKLKRYDRNSLVLQQESCHWYRPTTLQHLVELKWKYPNAKIVQGFSEIGVEIKFKFAEYQVVIDPTAVPELKLIRESKNHLVIGSTVTLSELQTYLKHYISWQPEEKTGICREILTMLHWFAGKHIRNTATWAGNLMTASPISDLNPLFMAAPGTKILVQSRERGERYVPVDENFFAGYRKTVVLPDEFVVHIEIPFTSKNEYFSGYKQAQRREDDIAIVNAGMYVRLTDDRKVKDIRLSFGGMAPTTIMALKTMQQLVGLTWNNVLMDTAAKSLLSETALPPGVPGGMEKFRQTLCMSFFFKFFETIRDKLELASADVVPKFEIAPHSPMTAIQIFRDVPEDHGAVGRPIAHLSGEKHTTGEANYCDDVAVAGALHMAFVLSERAHAKIKKVDPSHAMVAEGVVDFITHRDIPVNGTNVFAHNDQFIFARDEVLHYGQVIAAIVATDAEKARKAARLVRVEYEDLPVIVTIEQAIDKDSYLTGTFRVQNGDCDSAYNNCDRMIEGEVRVGGQEHFYLETNGCIVIPGEDDELEVIISTQNLTDVQKEISKVLAIPWHKVVCKVKRIGGGFGGKESAMLIPALPAAVAAYKLRKPVRVALERCDDMIMTGTRHPFLGRYKMGLDKNGRIQSYDVKMFSNCGYSYDLSVGVLQRGLLHVESVYSCPNFSALGRMCKTNVMSSTAFRAFGGPQAMFITESCLTDAAYAMDIEPEKLREMNMYKENEKTPYGQVLEQCNARRCWQECLSLSNFWQRRQEVNEWNTSSRYLKRGIAVIPTKFGVAFGLKHLNQAGALVHIYQDGTVLISHAGLEMGQGLHTKIVQIASNILEIPHAKICVTDTSTDKVPNTSPTAASVGSDINGMAVRNACEILKERLKPVHDANPHSTWEEIIDRAYKECISLSTTGFYKSDLPGYDFATGVGRPYNYYTYGAACSEVEIDCLTGDHKIMRTDIVMDVGESINPATDIGQIEGAFVQGYGLFTMEELKVSPSGIVFTRGPGAYKIPSADDAPRQFNVKLLRGSSNRGTIFASKAVGEPPLFLGSSVFFAIKDAIKSARKDFGLKGPFRMDSPATPERIRLACPDRLSEMVAEPVPGTYKPWTVSL